MYSVVLATMIAAGSSTPAFHHNRCHSCYSGCYSGYSCYAGYSGYACSGCHHGIFPLFHRHHCYGCTTYVYSSCSTCSCSRPVVYYTAPACCGGTVLTSPRVVPVPAANPEVDALRKEVDRLRKALDQKSEKVPGPKKGSEEEVAVPVSSRVTVTLPSDARLWVDNVECPLTSAVRSFSTPALNPNQQYSYTLRIELVRDGRVVSDSQRVIINPGQEARVDFNGAAVGTAAR